MKYSIQRTILSGAGIGTAVILIVAGFLAYSLFGGLLRHNFDDALLVKARLLMTLTEEGELDDGTWGIEFEFAEEFMPEFSGGESPEYFQLRYHDGLTHEYSDTLNKSDLPFLALTEPKISFSDLMLPNGKQGRLVHIGFVPQIPEQEERSPERLANQKSMIITLARERETLENNLTNIRRSITGFSIFTLMFIILLFWRVVRTGLSPLSEIRQQIDGIDANDLSRRVGLTNPPSELEGMQSQFNQLMARLEEAFLHEQQFSADVAHELRTPIAELKSATEVALKWPKDFDLAHRTLIEAQDISDQMTKLVEYLFALARCETDKIVVNLESIDLVALVDHLTRVFGQQAANKNLTVKKIQPPGALVSSDSTHLEMILANLISNAITHSPTGSEIQIVISMDQNTFKISFSNEAPALLDSDLPLMFNRLWQKDRSRTPSDHSGLGLSLVKAFAELLGLTTNATLSEQKSLTIELGNLKKSTAAD